MALFNNGFPATYPYYTPMQVPQQNPAQQQSTAQSGLIWVQGEAGAKSYLVAPNSTVQLWDSEDQVVYLKSADASGMPSMKILDYTIRDSAKNVANAVANVPAGISAGYATKEEIEGLKDQIKALREQVDGLQKRKRREDENE